VAAWVATVLRYGGVLAALLEPFIAYGAYPGYRRYGSRPMLFVSAGYVMRG
jgi:hypothetical protein